VSLGDLSPHEDLSSFDSKKHIKQEKEDKDQKE
jgi:hypothetical protein